MTDIKSRGDFAKMRKEERNKGIQEGIQIGIIQTIPKLLEIMTPQQISNEYNIDIKRVLEINSCE